MQYDVWKWKRDIKPFMSIHLESNYSFDDTITTTVNQNDTMTP